MINYPIDLAVDKDASVTTALMHPSPVDDVSLIKQISSAPASVTSASVDSENFDKESIPVPQYLLPKKVTVKRYILKK